MSRFEDGVSHEDHLVELPKGVETMPISELCKNLDKALISYMSIRISSLEVCEFLLGAVTNTLKGFDAFFDAYTNSSHFIVLRQIEERFGYFRDFLLQKKEKLLLPQPLHSELEAFFHSAKSRIITYDIFATDCQKLINAYTSQRVLKIFHGNPSDSFRIFILFMQEVNTIFFNLREMVKVYADQEGQLALMYQKFQERFVDVFLIFADYLSKNESKEEDKSRNDYLFSTFASLLFSPF